MIIDEEGRRIKKPVESSLDHLSSLFSSLLNSLCSSHIHFYLNLQPCSTFITLVFAIRFLIVTDCLSSPELLMLGFQNFYVSVSGDSPAVGSLVTVTGWGKPSDSAGGISEVLREVRDVKFELLRQKGFCQYHQGERHPSHEQR